MTGEPVTHAELNKLLTAQTDRILGKMDRVEDRLSADIKDVRIGCEDDVAKIESRVIKLEDYNRKQNFVGIVLGAVATTIVALFRNS